MEHLTTLTSSARNAFNTKCHLGAYALSRITKSATRLEAVCIYVQYECRCVLTLISANKLQLAASVS